MSQQAALLGFLLYILWLFVKDARRRAGLSRSLWMVVVWLVIIGSRPVSSWFNFGGEAGSVAEAYDAGNPIERQIYFILIVAGLYSLFKRGLRLREVIQNNKWLFVFFLYWALSIFWSDAPLVAVKRWIKDLGNIVMVLLILTESDPIQAIKAAFVRCAFVLVPLSVLFIKFFSGLGRAYHVWSGEMMYTGVTTHKNSLGSCVMVLGLFVLWDFLDRQQMKPKAKDWAGFITDLSLLGMSAWLLIKAHSATALGCAALGIAVFAGLSLPAVRARAGRLECYAVAGVIVMWLLNSVVDVQKLILVDFLGRDLTLTTRTEVWPMLLHQSDNFLLGAGFNSFWSGDRLEMIYAQLGIIQAHNGYLETYLNGGLLAVLLLVVLLFSASKSIKYELLSAGNYAKVRMMFLLIAIIYDFTEAAFNKMGLVWFALLLVIIQYPRAHSMRQPAESDTLSEASGCPASSDAGDGAAAGSNSCA